MSERDLDFHWDEFFWTATISLPSWGKAPIDMVFAPEGRGEGPMTDEETGLIRWVLAHEAEMAGALLSALLKEYPSLQEAYAYEDEEREEYMPDVETIDELKKLIRIQAVNVHQVSKAGRPYAGFELSCRWDEEHGVGVLMHGDRVVKIGGADTAILLWIAEADARESQ